MWTAERSVVAAVDRADVWAVWADVDRWSAWDHGIEWARLDGRFARGETYTLKPKGGPRLRATITRVEPRVGFTDVSRLPLCSLVFDHRVEEVTDGRVRITHRLTFRGPLAFLFRRVIGHDIVRDLPETLARIAARADSLRSQARVG